MFGLLLAGFYFIYSKLWVESVGKASCIIPENTSVIFSNVKLHELASVISLENDSSLSSIRSLARKFENANYSSPILACGVVGDRSFYSLSLVIKRFNEGVFNKMLTNYSKELDAEIIQNNSIHKISKDGKALLFVWKDAARVYVSNFDLGLTDSYLSESIARSVVADLERGNEFIFFPKKLFQIEPFAQLCKQFGGNQFSDSFYVAGNFIEADDKLEFAGLANLPKAGFSGSSPNNELWELIPSTIKRFSTGTKSEPIKFESDSLVKEFQPIANGFMSSTFYCFHQDSFKNSGKRFLIDSNLLMHNTINMIENVTNGQNEPLEYVLQIKDFIILSNTKSDLESFVSASKNLEMVNQLNHTNSTAPCIKLYSTPSIEMKGGAFILERLFESSSSCVINISQLNNQLSIKGQFNFDLPESTPSKEPDWSYRTNDSVVWGPHSVYNHQLKEQTALIATTHNFLVNLSAKGQPLWQYKLPEKPISIPIEVDFFQNQKIQYAITTPQYLVVIDRLGRPVGNYPLKFKDSTNTGIQVATVKKNTCFVRWASNVSVYDAKSQNQIESVKLPFKPTAIKWKLENARLKNKYAQVDSVLIKLAFAGQLDIDTLVLVDNEPKYLQKLNGDEALLWRNNEGKFFEWKNNKVDTQFAFVGEQSVYAFKGIESAPNAYGFLIGNEIKVVNSNNSLELLKKAGNSPFQNIEHLSSQPQIFYITNTNNEGYIIQLNAGIIEKLPALSSVKLLRKASGEKMLIGIADKQVFGFEL
ncbi:MAG: hypothetical protein KDC92_03310 [Bacteroidetes bacterium]|nr:hypothetical protein [Bacteroidota bacterium]